MTSVVESASIDEAFLDLTGSVRMLGTAGPDRGVRPRGRLRRAADHLLGGHRADQVHRQGRLPCRQAGRPGRGDAGRASRRSCTRCRSRRCGASARRRPTSCTGWGCSRSATSPHTPVGTLRRTFGPHAGRVLGELAWGRDPRRVVPQVPERSVGSQQTFAADSDRPEVVKRELLRMADRTASRMRKQGVRRAGRCRSRCVSRTSPSSPGPRRCPPSPTSRRRSTPRRSSCTTGSASTGRGSAGSGSGWSSWWTRTPPTASPGSPTPSAAGGRPTRPSMRQCRGSARRRCNGSS